jgi:hypothetical protein
MAGPADLRKSIIGFTASYYSQYSKVPPIRVIKLNFTLSNTEFYNAFPGGIEELCKACALPTPDRVAQTANAVRARTTEKTERKSSSSSANLPGTNILRITLTEVQSQRLLGLSHLEGGKDPLAILDHILDSDADRRKNSNLTLADESIVNKFVTSAILHGPWQNTEELVRFISKAYEYRIDELPRAAAFSLIRLAVELTDQNWDIPNFVDEVTKPYSVLNIYTKYRRGVVTPRSAIQDLRALTE